MVFYYQFFVGVLLLFLKDGKIFGEDFFEPVELKDVKLKVNELDI